MNRLYQGLKGKLFLFIILLVVGVISTLAIYTQNKLEKNLYRERRRQLKYLIDSAVKTIDYYYGLAEREKLSVQTAKQRAQEEVRNLRLGPEERNYFWLQTEDEEMIMHPLQSELEGTDVTNVQDQKGNFIFQQATQVTEDKEAGFINYYWQYYEDEDRTEPKLSYVKKFEPWGWIVGTGLYTNDLQAILAAMRQQIIIISLLILAAALLITYLVAQYITKPIKAVTGYAKLIAEGDLTEEMPPYLLRRDDEIGSLTQAFVIMKEKLQNLIANYQQKEAKLRKSKENLSQTLQAIGDGVMVTDAEGYITRMNAEAERLTGWKREKAEGKQLKEVFSITDAATGERVVNPVDKVLASGQISGLANDTVLTSKTGEEYQITDSAAPIQDVQGDITGVVLVFKDITEKYRHQQLLRISEERYRTLVTESPMGIFRTTSQGKILSANPALVKMLGCASEEEVFQHYEKLSKDLYVNQERRKEFITQLQQKGKISDFVYQARQVDGSFVWLEMDARISREQSGGTFIIEGFVSDITDRKQVEQALEKRRRDLETFFNVTPDLLCIADTDGHFVKLNQAWEEVLGYTVEELEESKFVNYVHPEDREDTQKAIAQLEDQKQVLNFVNRFQTKQGDYRYLEWRSHPQGDLIYAASRDITERKQKEEKIKYISFHDNLTDLYNRTYLEEEIKRLDVERQLPISLIMADLNGLKIINDTYGHEQGDQILIRTAEILQAACRKEDIIARWGGDEFVILLPQTKKKDGEDIHERIDKLCRETEGEGIPVSIALGVATKDQIDRDIYEVLNIAEERMYKNKLDESRSTKSHIVKALLNTLGEKSNETEEHAWRMQKLAFLMGEKLNLTQPELDKLSLLATLHDVGKTIIPSEILNKPRKLTAEEWQTIQEHPETGYRIASATEEFSHAAKEILHHHERWDGTGYPWGLAGKEIPLLSRIITIVDAYDVMTNGRSYKEAVSQEAALEELKACAGSQFDPELVEHFVEIIESDN